ncbi:MAG: Nif3-like dinuclear metal center hexameric protein [Clostridia bacterium]|nr:Nif3-like dinuclear metal center hexameric protein [Clostridia bacterium]
MIHNEILEWIEAFAPLSLACEWDNVGLMAGSREDKTRNVLFCLDLTESIIDSAAASGINLIITHHPLIFDKENPVAEGSLLARKIKKLNDSGITVYSAHSNLDKARGGVNDVLALRLGLTDIKADESQLHRVGSLPTAVPVSFFVDDKTSTFNSFNSKLVLPANLAMDDNVVTVGVCCGSFDGETDWMIENKVDILVTGEMKHHAALDLFEQGIAALEIGHYESEISGIMSLAAHVKKSMEAQLKHEGVALRIASKTNPYFDIFSFEEQNGGGL